MKEIINIRPHHLLCILNFAGVGYSEEFTTYLKNIKARIENDSIRIRLTKGQDDICMYCPNFKLCENMNFPNILDRKMILATDIEYGKIYDAKKLLDIINQKISWNILNIICENCAFYDKCKKVFLRKTTIDSHS